MVQKGARSHVQTDVALMNESALSQQTLTDTTRNCPDSASRYERSSRWAREQWKRSGHSYPQCGAGHVFTNRNLSKYFGMGEVDFPSAQFGQVVAILED